MRTILCIIGGVFGAGALALAALRCFPAAGMLALWAAVLLVGLLIERWRYKPLTAAAPGPDWQRTDERFVDPETGKLVTVYYKPLTAAAPGPDWQRTDERFVDPETGKLVTVYFHPATGERRYIAA